MCDDPCEDILAELFLEYDRRRSRGELPRAEEFRDAAGECFEQFAELLGEFTQVAGPEELPVADRLPRAFGEYTLVGLLGRGGVGIVYKALQKSLGRLVALKLLLGGWRTEEKLLRRFQRGAKAAAQVEHDHAVRIYDSGVIQGEAFIAMTLLQGKTLAEVLRELKGVDASPFGPEHHAVLDRAGVPGGGTDSTAYLRRMAALLAGPARALSNYHVLGIVHRDVKPGNMMLDGAGRLVLTDFDLVKRLDTVAHTMTTAALGTPLYMSPEQWTSESDDLDGRADVYSLGAILYEVITLRRPFEGANQQVLMRRVLQEKPIDPVRHVAGLPVAARRVALKCLEKRPGDRYQDAGGLARDLEAVAASEPVQAKPVPALRRIGRKARRNWKKLSLAATLLAAALVFWATRPEYVELHVTPDPRGGEVHLARMEGDSIVGEEEHLGTAPINDKFLVPGRYRVRIELEGFYPHSAVLDLDPDVAKTFSHEPILGGPPKAYQDYYARRHGKKKDLDAVEAYVPDPERGGDPPPDLPLLLYPRGRVLARDLVACVARLEREHEGQLVILDDGGGEILRRPVSLNLSHLPLAIPPDALRKLEAGKRYRWGFTLAGGGEVFESFEVVTLPSDPEQEALVSELRAHDELLARYVDVALLHRRGFHSTAWKMARELADRWPVKEVYSLSLQALEALDLEETEEWLDEYDRWIDAPKGL